MKLPTKNRLMYLPLAIAICAGPGLCDGRTGPAHAGADARATTHAAPPQRLAAPVAEAKLHALFEGYDHRDAFEASGVLYRDGEFLVVFDNREQIARIDQELPRNSKRNRLVGPSDRDSGFEGIAWDSHKREHAYVVVEAARRRGVYYPLVRQYDADLRYRGRRWTDHVLARRERNKGLEGIAWVRRDDADHLLGLIEGSGTVLVLRQDPDRWRTVAEIPAPAAFGDYSGIAVADDGRIAITSQEDAMLWVGHLDKGAWSFGADSATYRLPTGNNRGEIGKGRKRIYGNIEGVSWIGERRIVLVSDRKKSRQPGYTQFKDQSIHVFDLP